MDVCARQQLLRGVGMPQRIEGVALTINAFEQATVPHESSEGADENVGLVDEEIAAGAVRRSPREELCAMWAKPWSTCQRSSIRSGTV